MRIPHLFVAELGARRLSLTTAQQHHVQRVLRLRDGDPIIATDGRGSFLEAVLAGDTLEIRAAPTVRARPAPVIGVVQAIPSGRKLDEVVRFLGELGVAWLQPAVSRLAAPFAKGAASTRRLERLRTIAVSALEQSRSGWLLEVRDPANLTDAIAAGGRSLVLDPGADTLLGDVAIDGDDELVVVVGPEQGWDPEDLRVLASLPRVRLGREVLRTEHAAAAAVAGLLARTRWRGDPHA